MQEPTSDAKSIVQRILSEDTLTLNEARTELETALRKRPDKSTLYRWCMKGTNGCRLESILLGRQVFTSKQAITRFLIALHQQRVR